MTESRQERGPIIDPTKNVLDLVTATTKRLDDMRQASEKHFQDILAIRAVYDERLRVAETARIDAIRAVDVGAVNRAAEVSAQQALALAAQVATSAETLRTQVAAATAATINLAAALEPIQKDIADLRRAQYEAQGVKAQTGDSRQSTGMFVTIGVLVVSIIGLVLLYATK